MILTLRALVLVILFVGAYFAMFAFGWWCRGDAERRYAKMVNDRQRHIAALQRASR